MVKQHAAYKFEIDKQNKILRCIASGCFTKAEARAYIREFIRLIATIEGIEEYTLIVDASRQNLCPEETLPLITEVLNLYMDIPFKERRIVKFLNYDTNTQVSCMADKRFLDAFKAEDKKVEGNINNLELLNAKLKYAINDINNNPSRILDYDLFDLCKQLCKAGIITTLSEIQSFLLSDKNALEILTKYNQIIN